MAAAKKTPATPRSTAVSKPKPALPANYEERVQNDVASFKSRLAVQETNAIRVTQDKKFKVPHDGDDMKVDEIAGIIIDFAAHKRYYETDFDRDNPVPPNCFAVGFVPHDQLIPSDSSPELQCEEGDSCRNCPKNKFTQTANGKWLPKDCKDSYVIAMIAPDSDKLMTLSISSTAIKAFDKYIRELASNGFAPYQVVTHFSFDPKSDYSSVRAAMGKTVPKDVMGVVMSVRDDATLMVSQEPKTDGFEEKVVAKRLPPPKARGRK